MLQSVAASRVHSEPRPDYQHPRRMDDSIERLVGVEPRSYSQRAVESLGDVLDRDFVRQRPVAAGVDHRHVVAALFEDSLPDSERFTLVGITVNEHDGIPLHSANIGAATWAAAAIGNSILKR